jgi:hypothetical protein
MEKKTAKKKVVDIAGRSNYYNGPNYSSTKCLIYVLNLRFVRLKDF